MSPIFDRVISHHFTEVRINTSLLFQKIYVLPIDLYLAIQKIYAHH